MKWTWRDVDDIAVELVDRFPNLDPMSVSFPEIKKLVLDLPNFGDDPNVATDPLLEMIQAAWYDEFED